MLQIEAFFLFYHFLQPNCNLNSLSITNYLPSQSIIPSKQYFNQLKSVKTNAIQVCKKRKFKANSVLNVNIKIKFNKFNTTDKSNIEGKSKTYLYNKNINKIDALIKEEDEV